MSHTKPLFLICEKYVHSEYVFVRKFVCFENLPEIDTKNKFHGNSYARQSYCFLYGCPHKLLYFGLFFLIREEMESWRSLILVKLSAKIDILRIPKTFINILKKSKIVLHILLSVGSDNKSHKWLIICKLNIKV